MSSLRNQDIDRLIVNYREDYSPDVEAGLRSLHGRIAEPRVRQLNPRRRWLSAAATVLLLLVAAGWYFTQEDQSRIANTTDQPLEVALPDGTQVVLQQGATLAYAADYNLDDRQVDLTGQAFFEVAPDPARPFLVTAAATQLRVTGTAFNLRVMEGTLEVEVSEGSVILERATDRIAVGTNKCGIARPGQALRLMEAPNLNRHAWRTGELRFKNTPIDEVLHCLRTNWGIEATFAPGQACDYPVSGTYSGEDAGAVLADVAQLGGAQLRSVGTDGRTYQLSGPCTK